LGWKIKPRTLPTTFRRLGAAAADTKRSASYFRSCPHYTFCGVTAALAPSRALSASGESAVDNDVKT